MISRAVLCTFALLLAPAAARSEYTVPADVVSAGCGRSCGASHVLISTVGQPEVGVVGGQSHVSQMGLWYRSSWIVTGAVDIQPSSPRYSLGRNYPNPFNPVTLLTYSLPVDTEVTIRLYDVSGREVAAPVDGDKQAGYHQVMIDGSRLPSGVYFCRMVAGSFSQVRKLVLAK